MGTFPEIFILCSQILLQPVPSSFNLDVTNIYFVPLSPINNTINTWILVSSDRSPSIMEPTEFSCPEKLTKSSCLDPVLIKFKRQMSGVFNWSPLAGGSGFKKKKTQMSDWDLRAPALHQLKKDGPCVLFLILLKLFIDNVIFFDLDLLYHD